LKRREQIQQSKAFAALLTLRSCNRQIMPRWLWPVTAGLTKVDRQATILV